jgi:outer membrane protein assembly complex protein YaeT
MVDFQAMNMFYRKVLVICGVILSGVGVLIAEDTIKVDGLGWLADRGMDQRLDFLLGIGPDETPSLDSALIEDAAFLLLEQMRREGYLRPVLTATFSGSSGVEEARWETPYAIQLPVEFNADSVVFEIDRGELFYYHSVAVGGLEQVDIDEADRFFLPGGTLFSRKKDRAYTPENLARRKSRLLAALEEIGYAEAKIASHEVKMDDSTGAVELSLEVETGPLYRTGKTSVEVFEGDAAWATDLEFQEDVLFNRDWLREARAKVRQAAYERGYPDAEVRSRLLEPQPESVIYRQPVILELQLGSKVSLTGVRFEGDRDTKLSILRRKVKAESGDLLDPREIDRARRRLMALGIFRQVDYSYLPTTGESREVVYHLTPDTRQELQLLIGWGSYEQARAGFRWLHENPWGRAHRYTLSTKQSIKATRVVVDYEIPQLFGGDVTGYSEVEYSARQEIGYDRSRRGGLLGLSKLFGRSGIRMALEYGWFFEETDGIDANVLGVEDNAEVASLALRLSLDRRDNVLAPTDGYKLYVSAKAANTAFGGNVDFQKFEIGGSYHLSPSQSTMMHLSLRSGVLIGGRDELPFNERFFPGGENSVRGFQQGEASPLDSDGDPAGAESFWVGNLEIEQRLWDSLSVVSFVDAAGVSRDGSFGGDSANPISLGLGLRYQTVVGPLRLEYGHNLNPRAADPSGTLHFAIGFPF